MNLKAQFIHTFWEAMRNVNPTFVPSQSGEELNNLVSWLETNTVDDFTREELASLFAPLYYIAKQDYKWAMHMEKEIDNDG